MSGTNQHAIFSKEQTLIAEAEEALRSGALQKEHEAAFTELLAGFRKTLRQCGRLMSMGDRMQAQLSELNRDIAAKEARYRSIFQCAAEGVFRTTADGAFAEVNPAMAAIFGWSSVTEFMQHNASLASLFNSAQAYADYLIELCGSGSVTRYEAALRRKDGTPVWVEISTQVLHADSQAECGTTHVGVVLDVTDHKHMLEELSHMARTDPLTGLSNRRCFMETAHAEVERMHRNGKPLSLLMLDIDHFKHVNDTWGHDVGDIVLKTFAACLSSTMRNVDICARLGGEEFAVLLPETDHESALLAAERLRNAIATMPVAGHEFSVSSSLGLTTLRYADLFCRDHPKGSAASEKTAQPAGQIVEDMLKRADIALYAAKKNGRNRTEVYPPQCATGCTLPRCA
ncbi:diguanylate cyclase [Oleidesulfovibrio sp.]|uniref:sensor domain-containing diguanylate cyclase n=1 Tax=Oleidesulfovibrio sp. TaxID=2909707 RepID=UPI003A83F6DD